ncbi:DNA-3-methyladenine glycosylase I [Legionella spiritensis]|uniref:DNA-3-methyladenine glycosylase I n=1 Tax=Legionella spiritensis TaxID=452 RepID=UPI000F6D2D95|nr:DNA-3-methyladenine glycosylase I [Legionella spiritensis]VEG91610.1 3-methyladenine DNA glycosylase [Legionella spiritensis]
MTRCDWCGSDPLYIAYHDREWGEPVTSADKLFEMLILEGMQAGLNWLTVLKKREAMRDAFYSFSPDRLASATDADLAVMLENPGIIRNRLKIRSVRTNARTFLRIAEQGNIVDYFWQFTNGVTLQTNRQSLSEIPAVTKDSEKMAGQLKKDGFTFMGPTTCYAFMQAVGMVNDHITSCFRWQQLA